jgi:hypothetical protein
MACATSGAGGGRNSVLQLQHQRRARRVFRARLDLVRPPGNAIDGANKLQIIRLVRILQVL